MPVTERREREQTQRALDILTTWGRNPNGDGGENIVLCLSRQGAPSDAFLATGDCTPFTPTGKRGVLNGQPPADTGAPLAYFADFSSATPVINQIPCTSAFDLNEGTITLNGAFLELPATLDFTVEYINEFEDDDGANILFHSETTSDNAGYIVALAHVAASG